MLKSAARRAVVFTTLLAVGLLAGLALTSAVFDWRSDAATFTAPPRAVDEINFRNDPSHIAVDLTVDLAALESTLEREVPKQLWEIDRPDTECVAPQKVDLALFEIKSPKIKCHIMGKVTRGRLKLSGRGRNLMVAMPITGEVAARDIAGIFKGETGTGAANVRLLLQLDLTPDWQLVGTTNLAYDWTKEPGIDFLGQRITFTSKADRKLDDVRDSVRQIISRELANIGVRSAAENGWGKTHAVIELNRANPAVWARLTPQQFRFGGYEVEGRKLTLRLGLDTMIETFVGVKPDNHSPRRLQPLAPRAKADTRSILRVPVVADYAVLEPVLARALAKRAARPFKIADYGSVIAKFGKVSVYGGSSGRIVVGAKFEATSDLPLVKAATGTIWLAARPHSHSGSREVEFDNITISGDTSFVGQPLLLALANSVDFQDTISNALKQNFDNDFKKLAAKIERAVAHRHDGPLDYRVSIEKIDTGAIKAHGQGLYLPVEMTARASGKLLFVR